METVERFGCPFEDGVLEHGAGGHFVLPFKKELY
jgi:hypothetical protein